ncbi:translation initiation factor IF-1 [Candidatus Woesebacteria bacterium]|nr:translation initiation factor IF-1 [Candidatus Woesebacteria bacterium]QQG47803.1 MAG: translation initiation factor IF-1 [Candidatus Woesebacteria bacterium]
MARATNNIEIDGEVLSALPNTMFKVKLSDGRIILTTLTGRLRKHFVKILPGDRVKIEMTPYDKDRGRISYKY